MTATIGLDIGGTKIAAGLVSSTGEILTETRRDTPAHDPDRIAHDAAELVAELVLGATETVVGVGVTCAGFVNRTGSHVLFAPNLAWRDEPLKQRLEALVDYPVTIENDANAAAWGEFRFGAARDADDMVLITVGTGVGGGIVNDSRLLRGAYGVGGELGHMRVVPNGIRCGCGNRGCWEQYGSGSALLREARELIARTRGRRPTPASRRQTRPAQPAPERAARSPGPLARAARGRRPRWSPPAPAPACGGSTSGSGPRPRRPPAGTRSAGR